MQNRNGRMGTLNRAVLNLKKWVTIKLMAGRPQLTLVAVWSSYTLVRFICWSFLVRVTPLNLHIENYWKSEAMKVKFMKQKWGFFLLLMHSFQLLQKSGMQIESLNHTELLKTCVGVNVLQFYRGLESWERAEFRLKWDHSLKALSKENSENSGHKGLITSLIKAALFSFPGTQGVLIWYLQIYFSPNLHYFKVEAGGDDHGNSIEPLGIQQRGTVT